ncbi:glycosyltransferase family 4 protein [uncultured Desulfosarcina sp.]|uniref:glycosyltransferase family 4 protein n=1 Tax=uncultured Desulfosarcina sp. TaxID=218289 RepID=UPI0029C65C16|nr:glycosyltransferase family 4 protein [uncultured Desulfosarcina sp.]
MLNHNIKGKGTYIRCLNFAKNLVRFGHSVVILTSAPIHILRPKKEIIDGVEVICMPDPMGKRIRNGGLGPIDTFLRCIFLLINRTNFDIVESFDHRPAVFYPSLFAKYLLHIPLIAEWTDLHGEGGSLSLRPRKLQNLIGPYENFTECKSKKIAEKLIVISTWLKEKAVRIGVPEADIVYIPGGAEIDMIKPLPKKNVRKKFNLPMDQKIIGYTAGTHYDIRLLIETINQVQKARKDVLLVTTGATFDPRIRKQLNAPDRVVEFGFLSYDKYTRLLPAIDVFIFPFSDKTVNKGRWPNKIGDYMAAGRPTVSNKTGDLVALFEKHKIGLLASENPEDLSEKTLILLSDETMSKELGFNARQTAERYYDWRLLSKNLEACLAEVVKRHMNYSETDNPN